MWLQDLTGLVDEESIPKDFQILRANMDTERQIIAAEAVSADRWLSRWLIQHGVVSVAGCYSLRLLQPAAVTAWCCLNSRLFHMLACSTVGCFVFVLLFLHLKANDHI